jgi:adenylosuccinate synthase
MTQRAILVADLGFGDAGKGSLVDYLVRQHSAHTVIRYNGGAQAAHNVVTPDGRHHTFAQFGAGMFVPGTATHLSAYMLVAPPEMLAEARHLESLGVAAPFARTTLDRRARVITPYQQAANRLRELARGDARHGSCGLGIGETMSDWLTHGERVLLAGDLPDRAAARAKLAFIRDLKRAQLADVIASAPKTPAVEAQIAVFDNPTLIEATADLYALFAERLTLTDAAFTRDLMARPGTMVFEGAQGVLLDQDYGFHPYTTWSDTTFGSADALLSEGGYGGAVLRLGVVRAYTTRHGAGPFVTEDAELTARIPDRHNGDNPWQRTFRVGWFDAVATRYALNAVGGVDALAVTCLDRLLELPPSGWKTAYAYRYRPTRARIDDLPIRRPALMQDGIPVESARLARELTKMEPIYEMCTPHLPIYLESLERLLGVPVAITSAGVTADDKTIRLEALFA